MAESRNHAWTALTLPSRGVYYGGRIPDGKVEIRKMTVEEDLILNNRGMDLIQRINAITDACLRLPNGFDPGDLLMNDGMAALLYQRALTFGSKFKFSTTCRTCRKPFKTTVDFVEELNEQTPESLSEQHGGVEFTEPFFVSLPDSGATLEMRMLRRKEIVTIMRDAQRAPMHGPDMEGVDRTELLVMTRQIVTIGGEKQDALRRQSFIRGLTGLDAATIRSEVTKREPGIDTTIQRACPNCGAYNDLEVPIDMEFFRPTTL